MAAILGLVDCEGPTPHINANSNSRLGNFGGVYGCVQLLRWVDCLPFLPWTVRGRLHAPLCHYHESVVPSCRAAIASLHLVFYEWYIDDSIFCFVLWSWPYRFRRVISMANVIYPDSQARILC